MRNLLKTMAVIIMVTLLAQLTGIVTFAVSDELLENGGFESGTKDGFTLYGPENDREVITDDPHEGKYCLKISNRAGKYSTVMTDVTKLMALGGNGEYEITFWARLTKSETKQHDCQLVFNYAFEGEKDQYITSDIKPLTAEWQKFSFTKNLPMDFLRTTHVFIYPQVIGAYDADFCIDGISIKKHGELNGSERGDLPEPSTDVDPSEELVFNGGFEVDYWDDEETDEEIDNENYFEVYGPECTVSCESACAHNGEKGIGVSDRKGRYSTFKYEATEQMIDWGTGTYRASLWVRQRYEEQTESSCMLVMNYGLRKSGVHYVTTTATTLTTEWQRFVLTFKFDFTNISYIYFYPQVEGTKNVDFCLDDFSIVKYGEVGNDDIDVSEEADNFDASILEDLPLPKMGKIDVSGEAREPLTIGAIRWDAWYGHQKDAWEVCNQVEKTLSPAKYHFRAPFFADITDEGKILFPEYTQEIFDKEMEYAIDTGIDYFVYNWYNDGMRKARELHTTSQYKDKVKFCALLNGNSSDETLVEMAYLLQQDYYMTVFDGRPLMYYFGDAEPVKNDIIKFRQICQKLDIPAPYVVALNLGTAKTEATGADAISIYAIAGSGGESFESLTKHAKSTWKSYSVSGMQYVPTATAGWHSITRYENPVTWLTVGGDSYAEYGTADEIAAHIKDAIEYANVETPAKTVVNTVLVYAWNEHDEGGWLCPTLKVDENGNQLFGENGEKLIDTSRIEALKKVLTDAKALYGANEKPTATPDNGGQTAGGGLTWLIYAGGAVVVLVAVSVTAIVLVRKKKGKQHE